MYVEAKETIVGTFEQLLSVLTDGESHRSVASTGMNERSSRSHTIFRITLESRMTEAELAREKAEKGEIEGENKEVSIGQGCEGRLGM